MLEFESESESEIVEMIAARFAIALESTVSADEFAAIKRANIDHQDDGICASHDYCDANVLMAAAIEYVADILEPYDDASEETWTQYRDAMYQFWDAAWGVAKREHLTERSA